MHHRAFLCHACDGPVCHAFHRTLNKPAFLPPRDAVHFRFYAHDVISCFGGTSSPLRGARAPRRTWRGCRR